MDQQLNSDSKLNAIVVGKMKIMVSRKPKSYSN